MDRSHIKWEVLKSVVLRTKTFKACLLIALILATLALQLSSFHQDRFSIPEIKHEEEHFQAVHEESSEKIIENDDPPALESMESASLGLQSILQQGVKVMDLFGLADQESGGFQAFKQMVTLWNPESSKWAIQVSRKYKKAVELRPQRPKDWYDDKAEKLIKRNVLVEQCGCKREISAHTVVTYEGGDVGNASLSTCSKHSFYRGAKQKVVAFSFYGNPDSAQGKERKYFEGIKANLNEMPELYPDWVLRLYYDLDQDHPLLKDLCDLACNNVNIDLCYVKELPALGDVSKVFAMNWRFMPMLDPQVSHMVSRDLDSLINQREQAAVKEWLESDKAFHFMRDHPAHSIEILGSGWGVRMSPLERAFIDSAFMVAVKDPIFWAPRSAYGPDQGFLKRYLWPWGKWNAISHDAYTCTQFPRTQAFPTQRKMSVNNFVAAVISAKDVMRQKCPEKCRPKEHPDWEYC